jgi:hypothetical protein
MTIRYEVELRDAKQRALLTLPERGDEFHTAAEATGAAVAAAPRVPTAKFGYVTRVEPRRRVTVSVVTLR